MLLKKAKRTIIVNAGHWIDDSGAVVLCDTCNFPGTIKEPSLVERDEVMKIRDETVRLLEAEGFNVISVPDNLDLRKSIEFCNVYTKNPNDGLAIDIHLNRRGVSGDKSTRGSEVYYGVSGTSLGIARILSQEISKSLNIPNRGAKPDTVSAVGQLGWIRKVNCWSVVIECLYMDNREDQIALRAGGHKRAAQGIVSGIMKLYSLKKTVSGELDNEHLKKTLLQQIILLQAKVVQLLQQLIKLKS